MKYTKEQQLQKKVEKLEGKVKKSKLTPLPKLKKQVQTIVNAYVRERDAGLNCISCGKNCGPVQCGHYISQGSSGALRYNLDNLNVQGAGCNMYKHGNLIMYRQNLIKKIGVERVEYLEEHMHDVKKWTRSELEDILNSCKLKTYGVEY